MVVGMLFWSEMFSINYSVLITERMAGMQVQVILQISKAYSSLKFTTLDLIKTFYLMTHSTHFIYGYIALDMVKEQKLTATTWGTLSN